VGCDHVTPFQANVPGVLDRVAGMPGHYVFAGSSGAVAIPDVQIEEVLAEARKVVAADAAVRDQIAREQIRTNQSRSGHAKQTIMSSASDGVPRVAGPERNIGGKT
jgi:regulator of RNase E activity RraA